MRRLGIVPVSIAILVSVGFAPQAQTAAPDKVLKIVKVDGVGGFDYIHADVVERRLYVARSGNVTPRILVFDLDTLALDVRNHILFFTCWDPPIIMILNADNGTIITTLPIGKQ